MPLALILEDSPTDLRKAVDAARRAGFTEFELTGFAGNARTYLEKALSGGAPVPDVMVVDLDLGIDSGFEVIRYWHGKPQLKAIPVVIWSVMDDHEREICLLFGIYRFVSKHHDADALYETLVSLNSSNPGRSATG